MATLTSVPRWSLPTPRNLATEKPNRKLPAASTLPQDAAAYGEIPTIPNRGYYRV